MTTSATSCLTSPVIWTSRARGASVYDTNTFEVRRTLRSDDWVGRAIAFSPDSSKIAIGVGKIALYETETGDPVRVQ